MTNAPNKPKILTDHRKIISDSRTGTYIADIKSFPEHPPEAIAIRAYANWKDCPGYHEKDLATNRYGRIGILLKIPVLYRNSRPTSVVTKKIVHRRESQTPQSLAR